MKLNFWNSWIVNGRVNKLFIILFFIVAAFLNQLFLFPHFSTDSYLVMFNQEEHIRQSELLGRPLISILTLILDWFGVNLVRFQVFFTTISIFIMSLAVYLLVDLFFQFKKNASLNVLLILIVSSMVIVFNPFGIEMFTFSFMLPFTSLAVLLIIFSVRMLSTKINMLSIVYSIILITASLLLYQGWGALFVPLALIFVFFRNQLESVYFRVKEFFSIIFIYISACILNLSYIKIIHPLLFSNVSDRTKNNVQLMENFKAILKSQYNIWLSNFEITPKFTFLFISIIAFIFTCYIICKTNISKKEKIILVFLCIIVIFSLVFLSLAPHLITSIVWIVPRSIMPLSALPGLLFLMIVLFFSTNLKKLTGSFLLGLSLFYFLIVSISTNAVANDHLLVNKMDQEIARAFLNKIEDYEKEHGINIKKIAVINDSNPKWIYSNTHAFGDLNVSALNVSWSVPWLFQYVSGRGFEKTEMNKEIFEQNFKNKDWNFFSDEQIYINGDTAYLVMY